MTPEQADKILDAVVKSRYTTRAMVNAIPSHQSAATAADDAAFQTVLRLVNEATT